MDFKYKKLIENLERDKNKLCFEDDSPPKQQLQQACKFIKDNWDVCKKDLIHSLLEVQKGDNRVRDEQLFTNDDRDKLVTYISESITILSLQING